MFHALLGYKVSKNKAGFPVKSMIGTGTMTDPYRAPGVTV